MSEGLCSDIWSHIFEYTIGHPTHFVCAKWFRLTKHRVVYGSFITNKSTLFWGFQNGCCISDYLILTLIRHERIEALRHLLDKHFKQKGGYCHMTWQTIVSDAVSHGHIPTVQLLHQIVGDIVPYCSADAIRGGNVAMLRYISSISTGLVAIYGRTIMMNAALSGNMEILNWANEAGALCERDVGSLIKCAGYSNSIEILDRVYSIVSDRTDLAEHFNVLSLVAIEGSKGFRFNTLRWLRDKGMPWDNSKLLTIALKLPTPELLQWLYDNDYPIGSNLCDKIRRKGNINLLEWAREHGYQDHGPREEAE